MHGEFVLEIEHFVNLQQFAAELLELAAAILQLGLLYAGNLATAAGLGPGRSLVRRAVRRCPVPLVAEGRLHGEIISIAVNHSDVLVFLVGAAVGRVGSGLTVRGLATKTGIGF